MCSTGSISLGGSTTGRSVNCELFRSGTASINMDEAEVRELANVPSGSISMSDFYGSSFFKEPTIIGDCHPSWGGYYVGDNDGYHLFAAPEGATSRRVWSSDFVPLGAPVQVPDQVLEEYDEGFENTNAIGSDPAFLAAYVTSVFSFSGYSDWYLPAINELEEMYRNGVSEPNESNNPMPSGEEYLREAYWSSTASLEDACFGFYGGSSWYVYRAFAFDFETISEVSSAGTEIEPTINECLYVRPIRRIAY